MCVYPTVRGWQVTGLISLSHFTEIQGLLASVSSRKGTSDPFLRIPVADAVRVRPGHWLRSVI